MPLVLLPFLSSGFCPHRLDAGPGCAWFRRYQPFTPVIETLRSLLTAKPIGDNAWNRAPLVRRHRPGRAYLWSKRLFNRESSR